MTFIAQTPRDSSFSKVIKHLGMMLDRGDFVGWDKLKVSNLMKWLTTSPRGSILVTRPETRWSAPVPLWLSAHKEFNSVSYSHWDWTDPLVSLFVDRDILDQVSWYRSGGQVLGSDEVLENLDQVLEVKTGKRAGTMRNPASCATVYGVPEWKAPRLVKLAAFQFWMYHPSRRHNLMILGPELDSMPPPIHDATGEVFQKEEKKIEVPTLSEIWGLT